MYNKCSTLLYKYNPSHKKTHRIGGRSDNISILLNADSPTQHHNKSTIQYVIQHHNVNIRNGVALSIRISIVKFLPIY